MHGQRQRLRMPRWSCEEGRRVQLSETVEIRGHMLDSGTLTKILDDIRDYGGDYVIERFDVGKDHDDESYAQIVVTAADDNLSRLVNRLQGHGVNPVDPGGKPGDGLRTAGRRQPSAYDPGERGQGRRPDRLRDQRGPGRAGHSTG